MKRLPFISMEIEKAKTFSRKFLGFGEFLERIFPTMDFDLQQSEIGFNARQWLGLAFFAASLYFGIFVVSISTLVFLVNKNLLFGLGMGFISGTIIASAIFLYFSMYPKLMVKKKVKDIEKNMPHVLRHLLVQVRAGVTLFNSMNSIVIAGYGRLSDEMEKTVKDIDTGASQIDALEKLALNNPSLFFRRVIWQMINALKSGADIGTTLKEIVDNITSDQKTAIKRYGSELNPISLFYMMLVVIFPTLGIVFLIVIFAFVGLQFSLETILMTILSMLVVIQIMFIGLVKNKRPAGL